MIRVLSLVENTADKAGLLGEHGLAMWIEFGEQRVLFDTGQGLTLLNNARELGVNLEDTDAIVLSHGHYDHTGGLEVALDRARAAKVYAHPEAFYPRFSCYKSGTVRDVGIREVDKNSAQRRGVEITETKQPTEVVPGLFATGPVPRETHYEHTSGPFFLDRACRQPDPMNDDQALFFKTDMGVVVLLGCAHAGVINTLAYVQRLTNGGLIYAMIGGTHLRNASQEKINLTLDAMEQINIHSLHPAHCTGTRIVTQMQHRFPGRCQTWPVGAAISFPHGREPLCEMRG